MATSTLGCKFSDGKDRSVEYRARSHGCTSCFPNYQTKVCKARVTKEFVKITRSQSEILVHYTIEMVFQNLKVGQTKMLRHPRSLWGHKLYIAALRLEDHSLLVVVTQSGTQSAIADCVRHWGIKTRFGIFKTRSFCLKSTHLMDAGRLSKLFTLLLLAVCWVTTGGRVAPSDSATQAQTAWAQGQKHLSLRLRSSAKPCTQPQAKN